MHPHFPAAGSAGRQPPAPVLLVASGKGGVGKSTVAVSLARGLAGAGHRVGLIDADIHAPDIPLMLGLSRPQRARSLTINALPGTPGARLEPLRWNDLQVASAGFLVGDAQALPLGGGLAEALLTRLIWSTNWDRVSCLVLDLPPGTGVLTQYAIAIPGALTLLVVTPEQVAHLDTGRLVDLIAGATPGAGNAILGGATVGGIVGGVENMPTTRARTAVPTGRSIRQPIRQPPSGPGWPSWPASRYSPRLTRPNATTRCAPRCPRDRGCRRPAQLARTS